MSKHISAWAAILIGCCVLACSIGNAAERRVALVVGNSNYNNRSLVLSNPKNDAEDVAAALRSVGFEVMQAIDANRRDLDLNMAKFARLATDADAALFFYAGHALQYQGRNYLMPIDAEVEDEISLRYQMMLIDDVRAALDRASGVKIMILDACRNNPVVESLRRKASGESRSIGSVRGLARIDKTQGMVVAYSTAADEVAADGKGRNSPFTGAFLKRLREPGLEIEQLFRRVASDVNAETGGRQRPETYVSLLSDYYLNQTDRIAFEAIKDSPDPGVLRSFISKYPSSSYVSEALSQIQSIDNAAQQRQIQKNRQEEALRALEQQRRADQEAAQRREADQRAQLAAEQARRDAENAQRLQNEQRSKVARLEPPTAVPETADRRPDPKTKLTGVERQDMPGLPSAAPTEVTRPPEIRPVPAPEPIVAPSAGSCDQDRARLASLRSNPSRSELVRFEKELSCERLRAQVVRLHESLLPDPEPGPMPGGPTSSPLQPAASASPAKLPTLPEIPAPPIASSDKTVKPIPATDQPNLADLKALPSPANNAPGPVQTCAQDDARLTRLRASPSLAELIQFERELHCERLRPQIVRLRESLGAVAAPAPAGTDTTERSKPGQRAVDRQASAKPTASPAPVQTPQSCDQERARLARLRASQSRDEVLRFEQELACEQLRPQVMRLRESLTGG